MQTLKILQHEKWKEKTFWKQASSNVMGVNLTHWSDNFVFRFRVSFYVSRNYSAHLTSDFNDMWVENKKP